MSLAQISQAYHGEGTLLRRIEGAMLHSAAYIRIEAAETENHANRLLWMNAVQADVTTEAKKMLPRILQEQAIETNPDGVADEVIQYAVDYHLNSFATGV